MKSKATSFGIAALMVLMAFCCVSVTDEVDAFTTLTGMHFDSDDDKKSRLFTVNEGEFYGYAYTVSISVANINSNPQSYETLYVKNVQANGDKSISLNTNTDIDDSTVSITENASKGSYSIDIDWNSTGQLNYILGIQIDMKVTVGSVVVEMVPVNLRMSVTTSGSNDTDPMLTDMDFKVGKYDQIRVSESENTTPVLGDINLYHWYAEGLPEGLSMSENGYVSGIAEAADTVTAKVHIFGHEGNGEYTADLTINIGAATNDPDSFDYTINGGVGGPSTNCYDYVAVEGSSLTLTLSSEQQSDFTVKSVDENGNYSPIDVANGAYTLTAKGTGCYKVNIVCTNTSDNSQESKFFHIYVIPAFDVVQAQMTIASS